MCRPTPRAPHIYCCLWCQTFTVSVVATAAANLCCPLPFALAVYRLQQPFAIFNLIHITIVVAKICLPNLFLNVTSLTRQYCQLFIYHKSRPRYPEKCIQLCFSCKNLGWIQLLLFTKINSPFSCLYWLIIYHNRHSWHVGQWLATCI